MANDASKVLGTTQIIGVVVHPRNTARTALGGALGGIAGAVIAAKTQVAKAQTPNFGGAALLAVTDDDIALVRMRQGLTGFKLTDKVVTRLPHSSVASAELGKGALASPLTITMTDGAAWILEVAMVEVRRAKLLVDLLNEIRADAVGEGS
jgi:hypothetical protein